MTSVSHSQYAPSQPYEMPPKPASVQNEGRAETDAPPGAQADSTPPRPPMTAQQRGQFAAHKGLVNAPSSNASTNSPQLAQLSQENNQLRDSLNQLVAHFTPIITELEQQIANLGQQAGMMESPAKGGAPSKQDASGRADAGQGKVPPEASARADNNTPVSGSEAPRSLEQLTAENDQLRETIERLQTQFTAVVTKLQKQIQALTQKMGGADASANEAPAAGPKTDGNAPSAPPSAEQAPGAEDAPAAAQTHEPTPPANRSADDLMRDNQQLRARIDQMMTEFTQVITQLQQQVQQLSAQIKAQAK